MNYNAELKKAGANIAELARRLQITPALFEWRYNKPTKNFNFLKVLVKALDLLIYDLIQIRDEALREAWNLANAQKLEIKELEKLEK
jgi:hypothetical protein